MAELGMPNRPDLDPERRVQSAEYIADLTDELAKLARGSNLDLLAYLLDIASLEARTAANATPHRPTRVRQPAQAPRAAQG